MSFITDDHEEFRSAVRKFTDEEIVPIAADIDSYKYPDIPQEIIKKMAEQGYFGVIFPEEYDGLGLDYITLSIVSEELSKGLLRDRKSTRLNSSH